MLLDISTFIGKLISFSGELIGNPREKAEVVGGFVHEGHVVFIVAYQDGTIKEIAKNRDVKLAK